MQLQVIYKSGEQRIIHLHSSFFPSKSDFSPNEKIESYHEKAIKLAYEYGLHPYYIAVFKGGKVMFEKVNKQNKPLEFIKEKKIDEKKVKKILRKEFKNSKFTYKDKFTF